MYSSTCYNVVLLYSVLCNFILVTLKIFSQLYQQQKLRFCCYPSKERGTSNHGFPFSKGFVNFILFSLPVTHIPPTGTYFLPFPSPARPVVISYYITVLCPSSCVSHCFPCVVPTTSGNWCSVARTSCHVLNNYIISV